MLSPYWFRLEDKRGQKIKRAYGPESGTDEKHQGRGPDPEGGEAEVIGQAPAYSEDHSVARTIQSRTSW